MPRPLTPPKRVARDGVILYEKRVYLADGSRRVVRGRNLEEYRSNLAAVTVQKNLAKLGLSLPTTAAPAAAPDDGEPSDQRTELSLTEMHDLFLEEWENQAASKRPRKRGVDTKRSNLKQSQREWGDRPANSITDAEIEDWVADLLENGNALADRQRAGHKPWKPVAPQTVRNYQKDLQQSYRWVEERHPELVSNRALRAIQLVTVAPAPDPWPSWEFVFAFLDCFPLPCYRRAALFAFGSGLRPQEWVALDERHINRLNWVLSIRQTWGGYGVGIVPVGKNDRAFTPIHLSKLARQAVEVRPPGQADAPLLADEDGRRIDLKRFREGPWADALTAYNALGLEPEIVHRTPRQTRHTFASLNLSARGVETRELAALLRNDEATMMRYYAAVTPKLTERAAAAVDAVTPEYSGAAEAA